jgi:hypothetical protein
MSSQALIEYLTEVNGKLVREREEHCNNSATCICCYEFVDRVLPINKVDGVICRVNLRIQLYHISLLITCENILDNTYHGQRVVLYDESLVSIKKDEKMEKEHFVSALVELKKSLCILKFDRFNGQFKKDLKKPINQHFAEFLDGVSNITALHDTCCVCYCATLTKTPCNHPICMVCWDSIKENNGDVDCTRPCPICRNDIHLQRLD